MTPAMQSMIPATYVANIDASRGFYGLLGFREHSSGRAATSAWSVMQLGEHRILLASTSPPLDMPRLPLLFYLFFEDLDAVVTVLTAEGVDTVQLGHPPHALGGEVKVLDPDGNTVLLGQPERSPSQPTAPDDAVPRFSLLREAAALVQARGGATVTCQVSDMHGTGCRKQADVKLADTRGDTVWACLGHADEILVTVPGAFLASQDEEGIAVFLRSRRKRPDTGAPAGNP